MSARMSCNEPAAPECRLHVQCSVSSESAKGEQVFIYDLKTNSAGIDLALILI